MTVDGVFDALRRFAIRLSDAVERLPGGTVNPNYVVRDAEGNRFVLRRYVRNERPERIAMQVAFQEHLRAGGFPTTAFVESSEGSPIVTTERGSWTLTRFVDGSPFDFGRWGQVPEVGSRLAELHRIADLFAGEDVPAGGRVWGPAWCNDPDRHIADLRAFFGQDVAGELDELEECVRSAVSSVPAARVAELERTWTHGDYHGLNMIFDGDVLSALVDFDAVHLGSRVEDVARGVFSFGRERRGSIVLRPDVIREFLRAYESRCPLADIERAFIPAFMALYWAEDAEHAQRYAAMGRDTAGELRRKLPVLRALCDQRDLVASIVQQ